VIVLEYESSSAFSSKDLDCNHQCLCCLGIHLFGNPLCGPNDASLSHGWRALSYFRFIIILCETLFGGSTTHPSGVALRINHWNFSIGRRKWGGVVWAEQWVVSGVAAWLVATAPLWMILIDTLHPRGWEPSPWVMIGVILGFAGIFILIHPFQSMRQGDVDLIGAVVLVLASLFWSIGSLYSRQAKLPSSPLLGTGMEMLAGGGGLLLLGILSGEWKQMSLISISKESWLGLSYLIVFGSLIGFTAYTWLLRAAPTPLVSTYAYVNPIVAVSLGYFIAEEPLTFRILIAMVLVVGSVALITITQQRSLRSKGAPLKSNAKG